MASDADKSLQASSSFLTENDIPGTSLEGRKVPELKTVELRFWLKYQGNPAKGLKTKA